MRRNLVIVRAGRASLHARWLRDAAERNFDLFVSWYDSEDTAPPSALERGDHFEAIPGMKWPRLHELWSERREWLSAYDAFWFPDDDISSNGSNVCRMFELLHAHSLWLAQPALGPSSYVTHPITRRVAGVALRFTSFVEVMCPLFSRYALERLVHTFSESVSGWGLDYLWPHVLGYPNDRVAILDATPVVHTRRPGTGANYARCASLGVRPPNEAARILKTHGIRKPAFETYGSIVTSAPR